MKLRDSDDIRLLRDVDIVEVNGIEEYVINILLILAVCNKLITKIQTVL